MMLRIITQEDCYYCVKAKELMKSKGVGYVEYPALGLNLALMKMANLKTVPQIFSEDNQYIGGYTELKEYLTNQEK